MCSNQSDWSVFSAGEPHSSETRKPQLRRKPLPGIPFSSPAPNYAVSLATQMTPHSLQAVPLVPAWSWPVWSPVPGHPAVCWASPYCIAAVLRVPMSPPTLGSELLGRPSGLTPFGLGTSEAQRSAHHAVRPSRINWMKVLSSIRFYVDYPM